MQRKITLTEGWGGKGASVFIREVRKAPEKGGLKGDLPGLQEQPSYFPLPEHSTGREHGGTGRRYVSFALTGPPAGPKHEADPRQRNRRLVCSAGARPRGETGPARASPGQAERRGKPRCKAAIDSGDGRQTGVILARPVWADFSWPRRPVLGDRNVTLSLVPGAHHPCGLSPPTFRTIGRGQTALLLFFNCLRLKRIRLPRWRHLG